MRKLSRLTLAVLSVLVTFSVRAQERASISGYVRDATSGETLLLANVRLEGTTQGAATNNAGYYALAGITPGEHVLIASYVGYRPERIEIALDAGEQRRLDVELVPEGLAIDGVTVTAEQELEYEARRVGVQQLQTELIKSLPTVLQPDVFRSLQLLPGVKAASDYSSGLYIRGGSPDQTLILLDRTTVYNPSHFFGFFSTFNPDAIKDVRLYKGGFPAEYGGRIGSVVDIYNRDGNRREFDAGMSVGLLSSRVIAEGPYARGSYMLALRRSTLEPLLYMLHAADVDGIPDSFYFFDANGKLNVDLSSRDQLSLAFYAGGDRLNIELLDDLHADIRYGNRTLSLNWTHLFSETLFSNFTATGSRYYSAPELDFSGTSIVRDNSVGDFSAKADFEYVPGERLSAKAGFWTGAFLFRLRDLFDDDVSLDESIRSLYTSVYGQSTYRPIPGVSLQAGLRANFFQEGDFYRIAPRLSAEYEPASTVRLQIAYGRYFQFLTLVTSELFSGFDTWLTTGDHVPPAFGDQVVIGVKSALTSGINVDVEAYYRTMENLFELDPFVQNPAGREYVELFRFGDGHAYGFETILQRTEGRLNGFLAYTLSRTRRRFPNVNGGAFYPPKYDRTHDVKIVLNYDLSRTWRAIGVWTYATGQAYTEPLAQYRLIGQPFDTDTRGVLVTEYNASRLPAYHRFDVGVSRRGTVFGSVGYELQMQVINAYNRRNIWFYLFDFTEGKDVERNEVPQIPVPIPNLSLTLDF